MATVYKELVLDAPPDAVWDAVRDVGAVHARLFPGYLVDARLDDATAIPTRVVTFANGLVVREQIVAVDDAARRVAWTAVGGRATHHHASMQVHPASTAAGGARTRLVWVTDVLPDELAAPVRALVEGGAEVVVQTFAAGAAPSAGAPDPAEHEVALRDALHAVGPAPHLARELAPFGRLVGSWDLDVTYYTDDGAVRQRVAGEWHFGWVLEGRAVADVWMVPPRAARQATDPAPGECGLSLRFYDPRLGAWRSTWHGPVHGLVWPFVAREVGDEVVLERTDDAGTRVRWIFSDVHADSFRWRAVESADGGATWRLRQTMEAVRRQGGSPAPSTP